MEVTTHLRDVVDLDDVEREIDAGYIKRRYHPEFPELAILNYTDRCQFDQHWTETTRVCRGLIYNSFTMTVIARPFAKFFNYGDLTVDARDFDLDAAVFHIGDKLDGSLGIMYERPDGLAAIATRGSFESEQAKHATELLREALGGGTWHSEGVCTMLFEIIYPENRIVLDYGDRDELVLLGAVSNVTGEYFAPDGASADRASLRQVLARPPRKNAEGYVVWLDQSNAVKIKQDDYVALHRIISNLTKKEVWRQLRAGTFDEFAAQLPDEFHEWARKERWARLREFTDIHHEATMEFNAIRALVAPRDRGTFAKYAKVAKHTGLLFMLYDDKNISDSIWRSIEPKGE